MCMILYSDLLLVLCRIYIYEASQNRSNTMEILFWRKTDRNYYRLKSSLEILINYSISNVRLESHLFNYCRAARI